MPRASEPGEAFEAAAALPPGAPVLQQLRRLLGQVDAEVERFGPRCWGGGTCCKFDLFSHRLYASTAELALLAAQPPVDMTRCAGRRCPYQLGPACTARSARPLGCRTFFCRPDAPQALEALCEQYHVRIRQLHQDFALPYAYAEITLALPEIAAERATFG
ncbi:MAG: hypothetical protein ACOC93_06000 [Planctomycetota bacterium]